MPARLVALSGTDDITLSGLLTIAGRHPACDARLTSYRVSRRHCCLALDGGGVLVRDLGSTNGTWINGRSVDEGVLRPGDILGIAHLRFRFVLPGPAGGGLPAAPPRGPEGDPALALARDTSHYVVEASPDGGPGRGPAERG
jgi:hypothetical protein